MTLVGKKAPQFVAKAVVNGRIEENFDISTYFGKYIVLFFYPLDFTFVCPTELHAFQERLNEFEQRDAVVMGCSIDSWFSHFAWLSTPKSKGGIQGITYPVISDIHKSIAKDYHVLKEEDGVSYRGLFLIDKTGIIRHQLVNDLPIGRSVGEVIRTLDALIFHEKNGEVCPANWQEGKKAMKPTQEGLVEYFD